MQCFVVMHLIIQLLKNAAWAEPKAKPDNTCRSAGILKFEPGTHPSQRSKGMEVCSKYHKSTCCNDTHANTLRPKIREPVVAKFSRSCQALTEEMICSSCHPLMGTCEMKNACPRICNDWLNACRNEYYAHAGAGALAPCYGNALICSPLKSIAKSGADFCRHMGFHVGSDTDTEGIDCFDGSIPDQLGEIEPSGPWQTQLMGYLKKEAEDPSGLFIAGCFILITIMLLGKRVARRLGDPFGGDQLNLIEVRLLQQERYQRGERMYDDETDSCSEEEEASANNIDISERLESE